jgi:tetratricopeptide (TPR) repeat protein
MPGSTRPRGHIGRFKSWRGRSCFRSALLVCLAFAAGLLIVTTSRPAAAQDFAAAGQHFAAAQDAFAQGQYQRAAESYQAAYDITRDGALLFNIGESWQRAGNAQKALVAYREYLKDPGGSERAEVEKRVQSLEATGAEPGKPGPGNPPPSGVPTSIPTTSGTVTPEKTPEKSPTVVTPGGPPAKPSRLRTGAWISVAVSVALATAGAILGLGAQNRADELQRRTTVLLNNQPPLYSEDQRQAYEGLVSEGRAYNSASIALLSVAGVALAAGGAMFIADWVSRPKSEKSRLAKSEKRLLPGLNIGAGQAILTAGGSF